MNEYQIKRGNRLSTISFGIIIFLLAGGEFTNKGSFMGGGVTFQSPSLLYIAIVLVYLFYNFKYWVTNKHPFRILFKQIERRFKNRPFVLNFFKSKTKVEIKRKFEDGKNIGGKVWNKESNKIPSHATINNGSNYPYSKKRVGLKYLFRLPVYIYNKDKSSFFADPRESPVETEVSFFRYQYLYWRSFLGYILSDDNFSSSFVPYILSFIAGCMMIYRIFNSYIF